MNRLKLILKRNFIIVMTFMLVAALPAPVFADTSSTAAAGGLVAAPTNGTDRPTGVAAKTYQFNEANGLWENEHYTWNPVTKETLPKSAPEYTYNAATGMWDTEIWEYRPATSAYLLVPVSVTTPPAGAARHGGPAAVVSTPAAESDPADNETSESGSGNTLASSAPGVAGTGNTSTDDDTGTRLNTTSGVTLNTEINSAAQSGDVQVTRNMLAGDGATGSATASATVLNLLQSSSSLAGASLAIFNADIQGDISGDLLIDPAAFMQPASLNENDLNSLRINSEFNGAVQNDIVLDAASGNAIATDNTTVGNISTGGANAIANVLNMINSVVAANQSFLGVINIHGNYTGDILVPAGSLNALLAGNAPTSSATESTDTALAVNSSSEQNIDNNIDLAAVSGNASSNDNTNAGNVASGNALTRLTILNLTGREVNAANSLLVFVNVLGSWVGLIMDAPAGTTAAALGGGVTEDAEAVRQQASLSTSDTTMNRVDNASITNNISARARSGDADATGNFRVGDIATGNATASANVANVMNSQFSLSNWFGVLFINVFGSWIGSFGAAESDELATAGANAAGGSESAGAGSTVVSSPRLFSFVSPSDSALGLSPVDRTSFGSEQEYEEFVETVSTLVTESEIVESVVERTNPRPKASDQGGFSLSALPIVLGLAGLSFVGTERIRAIRRTLHGQLR